jgi:hypothetical protein
VHAEVNNALVGVDEDRDFSAVRCVLDRIPDEVEEDLAELVAVGPNREERAGSHAVEDERTTA